MDYAPTTVAKTMFREVVASGTDAPEMIWHDWKALIDGGDGLYYWYITKNFTGIGRIDREVDRGYVWSNAAGYKADKTPVYLILVAQSPAAVVKSPHHIGGHVVRSTWDQVKAMCPKPDWV